jgi:ribosomal protein L40E
MTAHTRVICDRCGRAVPRHAHYRVRIEVVADPSPPELTQEDLDETDFDWTMAQLLDEMKHATADELEDAVARSFEFRICRSCQLRLLRDPLGRRDGPEAT